MSSVQLSYNLYRLARSLFRRNLLSTCRGAVYRGTFNPACIEVEADRQ
nr:MAG TPA: hypothetical protein [Caudoviricetes sp.]